MSIFTDKEQLFNNFHSIDFSNAIGSPISLAETKDHLKVTFDDDDDYISSLIDACIDAIEKYTSTSITEKTVTITADIVKEFELPYGPVIDFTSVSNKVSNVYTAISSTGYTIDDIQFARYIPGSTGRLKFVYTAGYDADIPAALKLAVLNEIAFRYENRGDMTNKFAQQNVGICESAQILANPFRRLSWL